MKMQCDKCHLVFGEQTDIYHWDRVPGKICGESRKQGKSCYGALIRAPELSYTLKFVYLASVTHEWYQKTERGSECFVDRYAGALAPSHKLILTDLNQAYRYCSELPSGLGARPAHYYTVEEV